MFINITVKKHKFASDLVTAPDSSPPKRSSVAVGEVAGVAPFDSVPFLARRRTLRTARA